MEILNNLKPEPSCGCDGISTKLLKTCKLEICTSLTLIINQTLSIGIFPDSLKVAKVIPLYKKDDKAYWVMRDSQTWLITQVIVTRGAACQVISELPVCPDYTVHTSQAAKQDNKTHLT